MRKKEVIDMVIINMAAEGSNTLKSGKVEIDLAARQVKVKGKVVNLDEEEYDVVVMMARHHLL